MDWLDSWTFELFIEKHKIKTEFFSRVLHPFILSVNKYLLSADLY